MTSFKDHDICASCYASFSLTRRKHHCRNCFQTFCSECSQHTATIVRLGYDTPVRVCATCAQALDQEENTPEHEPVWHQFSSPSSPSSSSLLLPASPASLDLHQGLYVHVDGGAEERDFYDRRTSHDYTVCTAQTDPRVMTVEQLRMEVSRLRGVEAENRQLHSAVAQLGQRMSRSAGVRHQEPAEESHEYFYHLLGVLDKAGRVFEQFHSQSPDTEQEPTQQQAQQHTPPIIDFDPHDGDDDDSYAHDIIELDDQPTQALYDEHCNTTNATELAFLHLIHQVASLCQHHHLSPISFPSISLSPDRESRGDSDGDGVAAESSVCVALHALRNDALEDVTRRFLVSLLCHCTRVYRVTTLAKALRGNALPEQLQWCDDNVQEESPAWIGDDTLSVCQECHVAFSFFRRRHHCRVCGGLYCAACCSLSMDVPRLKVYQLRVCRVCMHMLQDDSHSSSSPHAQQQSPAPLSMAGESTV